ncbi:MAG: Ribosomal RNA small subunit methyltransferase E [Elusimicrobia bacterium]|nr:Ribosomal RNA small subunit methyltransferase E [Elusimicrobiota bacterium]
MSQIFIPPENIVGQNFFLENREAHHVLNVLRKKIGDQINLFDGQGRQYIGALTVVDESSSHCRGQIVSEAVPSQHKVALFLFQGFPKGSKFDFVVEKATELGVDGITPFLSDKNPVRTHHEWNSKKQRWERVALAAAKQCGRSTLPAISEPRSLKELEYSLKDGVSFFFSLAPDSKNLRECLDPGKVKNLRKINLIVGPESGFSAMESEWFRTLGCTPLTLGSLTFRSETAGLVGLSIVKYELGLL